MGGFLFSNPLLLIGLAGLPLLWWWLRALPPEPRTMVFPALRLIRKTTAPVAQSRPPLWLILLRLALAALVIFAASGPTWRSTGDINKSSSLIIIVDNGWEAASALRQAPELAQTAIRNLPADTGRVAILTTAPPSVGWPKSPRLSWLAPDVAEADLRTLTAQPWPSNRGGFAQTYGPLLSQSRVPVLWLSDGTAPASAQQLASILTSGHRVDAARLSDTGPLAFRNVASRPEGLAVDVIALPQSGDRAIQLVTRQSDGKIGSTAQVLLPGGETSVRALLPVAPTDRLKLQHLEIAGESSAAATFLMDDNLSRPLVGLYSGDTIEQKQPLRSGSYYLKRALETHAEVREGSIDALLDLPVNVLILTDVGAFPAAIRQRLEAWLNGGGLLLSFAGPRMAESGSPFAPVPLRPASRTMGGALSWGTPVSLAPFAATSPFAGIAIDPKVSVARQVLAEPAANLASYAWATLADGTPLITASRRGAGLSVLVHTTAGPDWTDLPLSGMFEQMLRQVLPLAGRAGDAGKTATGDLVLDVALGGDGTLISPKALSSPIAATLFEQTSSSPVHPPGLYRTGGRLLALNLARTAGPIGPRFALEPITRWPSGVGDYRPRQTSFPLAPALWQLSLLLLALDGLATLFVRGRLPKLRAARPALASLAILFLMPEPTLAAPPGALDVRIGYVTGALAASVDAGSSLAMLNDALLTRTAIRPGPATAVVPGRDPLGFYTIVYWPVPANAQPLDGKAALAVARYLAVGGLLLIDTATAGATPAARAQSASRMLSSLSLPRLEPMTDAHVLAKSFYLLGKGPARPLMSQLWVEADTRGTDGRTSGLIIGSQNLARNLMDTQIDSENREAALRLGINAIMYALTGTYKADQVHAAGLLERLQNDAPKVQRVDP